jgi:hypothetical protein
MDQNNYSNEQGRLPAGPFNVPAEPEPAMDTQPQAPQQMPEPVHLDDFETDAELQAKTTDEDTDLGEMIQQNLDEAASTTSRNAAKMGLSVPLSNVEKIVKVQTDEFVRQRDHVSDAIADLTSPLQSIHASLDLFSNASKLLQDALKKIDDPDQVLQPKVANRGDGNANVFRRYSETPTRLTGRDGFMALNALTGGLKKVYLWNSGITVNMRAIPLDVLNNFNRVVSADDYEYGRNFGAFYYLFADLNLTEHIIDKILRTVICGSSFVGYSDFNQLMSVISWQDFHTLLWAAGCMLHPNGLDIRFVCGECGHVENVYSDLSKLHLLNTSLISDQMVDHFAKKHHTVADLDEYRKFSNLGKEIEFQYTDGDTVTKWKVKLKQCSIAEYREIGRKYNAELRKNCTLTDASEVNSYMQYSQMKCLRPWIDSMVVTKINGAGEAASVEIVNDPNDQFSAQSVDSALDTLQADYPKFTQLVEDYITSTQISKICFKYPECPKCHKVPELSNNGYITYDPMMTFFILSLRRLFKTSVDVTK